MDTTKNNKPATRKASQTLSLISKQHLSLGTINAFIGGMYQKMEEIEEYKQNIRSETEISMWTLLNAYKTQEDRTGLIAWQTSLCQPDHVDVLPLSRCRNANDELLNRLLLIMIIDLAESFNLPEGKNLSETQARDLCVHIVLKFPHFSVEDVAVCLERIREGSYGKVFALDTNKMLEYLNTYNSEREAAIRQLREHTHGTTKEMSPAGGGFSAQAGNGTGWTSMKDNMNTLATQNEIHPTIIPKKYEGKESKKGANKTAEEAKQ